MQANPSIDRGYPKLAREMSRFSEFAIFRRFEYLNMLNLLRLQAELVDLESELQVIQQEDNKATDGVKNNFSVDFYLLFKSKATPGDDLQIIILEKIGEKLREYYTALQQTKQVQSIGKPTSRDMGNLQYWLEDADGGNFFLRAFEANTWASLNVGNVESVESFVSLLKGRLVDDPFAEWLSSVFSGIYEGFLKVVGQTRRQGGQLVSRPNRLNLISASLTVMLSSVLPTVSIFALYYTEKLVARLGVIVVLTTAFAGLLSLFTSAEKVDIFAITAAFAAVEVVFVGSTATNTTGS